MRLLLEPWRWLTAPKFYGVERVPRDRPFLLVANHTLMGVLDVPLLIQGLYEQRGVFVRSLGDHLHFQVPVWRELLMRFGTVVYVQRGSERLRGKPGGLRVVRGVLIGAQGHGRRVRLIENDRLATVGYCTKRGDVGWWSASVVSDRKPWS